MESYPSGASPFSVWDMAGAVAVADRYATTSCHHALDAGPARPETGFCSVRSRAHEALDAHVPRRLFGAPTWV